MSINRSGETIVELATQSRKSFDFTSFVGYLMFLLEIKIKLRSFKSSERINEKGDGPYHGFGYLSLFSDPIDLATWKFFAAASIIIIIKKNARLTRK